MRFRNNRLTSGFEPDELGKTPEERRALDELFSITYEELRRLASTGWPLIIAGLSVSVYMRVDQIMLGQMLGDTDVGVFSAAVRISEAF